METLNLETKSNGVAKQPENGLQTYDLTKDLPDLEDSEVLPFDLMGDYWTPTAKDEWKKVFFDKIQVRSVKDMQNEDVIIDLECAFFMETVVVNGKKETKTICNGSKRLVGAILSNNIQKGTPLLITYLGKKKNKGNSFQSDQWSVKPLILKIK